MPIQASAYFTSDGTSQDRLRRVYTLLAVGLVLLTCLVGWALLSNLNARDEQRHIKIAQLAMSQAQRQMEFLLVRYGKQLVSSATDPNFVTRLMAEPSATARNSPFYPLISSTLTFQMFLWFDPQGQLQSAMVRGANRPILGNLAGLKQTLPLTALQAGLAIDCQSLWFSQPLEVVLETGERKRLIFGSVAVSGPNGQSLGYLMLGVNFGVLAELLAGDADHNELAQLMLTDEQGQALVSWIKTANDSQPNLEIRQWQKPMTVSWLGREFDGFQVVDSPKLTLQAWANPRYWQDDQRKNIRLVLGACGAVLCLLLLALWRLYRYADHLQQLLVREAHVRRSARLGYWRFDPSKQHLVLSKSLLHGFDLLSHKTQWADFLAGITNPQERQALVDAVARCSLSGERFELEVELRHPTHGRTGWTLVTGERSASGQIEGAMQDITQRKQAELSAEAFRSNLRNIVDWARLGVWEFDLVNGERRINTYLRDMLGLDMPMTGEYLVFNWAPLSHPDDVPAATQARLDYIAGKTPYYSAQLRVKHSQGHWVAFALEGEHVTFDEQGQPTLIRGTAMDVTELYEARSVAEEANQAKTRFLSRMSHELRTPLNGIMGYTQLLRMSPNLDAQEQDHLNAVLAGSRHLLNLINDLLQITSDDPLAAPVQFQRERVSLSELTLRCTKLMQPLMTEKQQLVHNRISAEHWVLADSLRTQQCLINILANAIKYSPEHTTISMEATQTSNGLVRISVRDQGPGIAPEVGQQVFEPFFRSQSAQLSTEGAGIGLAVSLRLAQQMGGHISFESTLGVGTVFHLDLPAATPEMASTPAATSTTTSTTRTPVLTASA